MNEVTYVEGFHNKEAVQKMKYGPLGNTGLRVSIMALGGAPLGGLYESIEVEEGASFVKEALQSGINYIDTAPFYGQGRSEEVIGKALKDIPRKAYYIATKVGRFNWNVEDAFDFSAAKTRQSVDRSLKLLGLDYIDVIQIHDIDYAENLDEIINETLPALKEVVDEGKARYIGITAYSLSTLKEALQRSKVKIDCILSFTRFTLIDDELVKYMPFFQEKGVAVINAASLAQGLLTPVGPSEWQLACPEIKEAAKKAAEYCKKKNADIAKLALQYSCTLKGIHTHVVGVGKIEFLRQNLKIMTEEPSENERKLAQDVRQRFFVNLSKKNWEWEDPLYEKLKEFRSKN